MILPEIKKTSCYYISLLFILRFHGITFDGVFNDLLNETNFYYDDYNKVFNSLKLIFNLQQKGLKVSHNHFCKNQKTKKFLSKLTINSWVVIGMDCYLIPWHHLYKKFHSPHYFPAQKIDDNFFCAYDPMYNISNKIISTNDLEKDAMEVKVISLGEFKTTKQNKKNSDETNYLTKIKNKLFYNLNNYYRLTDVGKIKIYQYASAILNNRFLLKNKLILEGKNVKIIEEFENNIVALWELIFLGLQKMYCTSKTEVLKENLKDLILKVINNEELFQAYNVL